MMWAGAVGAPPDIKWWDVKYTSACTNIRTWCCGTYSFALGLEIPTGRCRQTNSIGFDRLLQRFCGSSSYPFLCETLFITCSHSLEELGILLAQGRQHVIEA